MPTNAKSLVIFILFAVLWLENKARHCGSRHEKTHKKIEKVKTSTKTPAMTTATPIKVNPKCNTETVPSCKCNLADDSDYNNYPADGLYYPVPKSGKCTDVFKRLSTTPADYHFIEENCSKVQRTVCSVNSWCDAHYFNDYGTPPPTPDAFVLGQHTSGEPFCDCGYANRQIPKSGNCTDLDTASDDTGITCDKMQTLCRDTCFCNDNYVDPTKCVPQTCNNVTEPFCKCGIDGDHYPVPESGNCMEVLRLFSTTPTYNDRFGFGCLKFRTVCKCVPWDGIHCECNDECLSGCE